MARVRDLIRAGMLSLREPTPARFLALRAFDAVFDVLSYDHKIGVRSIPRPHYAFGLLHAARLASRLGLRHISALEFGVAGGNGLVALEAHAARVTRETGIAIDIYGFDTGSGLPPSTDYRDMPYAWERGFYAMDIGKLRARLHRATLILGDVAATVRDFASREPPPVGFIAFDLDYYSSTVAALDVLCLGDRDLLPRVFCYFDDVAGGADFCFGEFTGELLAIKEFNQAHAGRKLARLAGLRHAFGSLPALWHEQMYVAHIFCHPLYGVPAHHGEDDLALR